MKAHDRDSQSAMTPEKAKQILIEGNKRFQKSLKADRDLMGQVNDTADGQYPLATILSCIDSRVSSELIFDQGIGDIFSVRIAGNFVNTDILGSMEFACKLAGTPLIVIMGHTSCGAIKGACDRARLGNLSHLIRRLEPAVTATATPVSKDQRTSKNLVFVDAVARTNVEMTIEQLRDVSPVLAQMEEAGEIKVIGAMYDISTGVVDFID